MTREKAIKILSSYKNSFFGDARHGGVISVSEIIGLLSAQPNNQVNLCDSCKYSYPDCPSETDDVIFGNGKGNDNICACNKYLPSAQQERKSGKWIEIKRSDINPLTGRCGVYVGCSECGAPIPTDSQLDYIDESEANYCINCGTDMRGEQDG